ERGADRRGHHLRDRGKLRVSPAGGDDAPHDVALREDADQLPLVEDNDSADRLLDHQLADLLHGRPRIGGDYGSAGGSHLSHGVLLSAAILMMSYYNPTSHRERPYKRLRPVGLVRAAKRPTGVQAPHRCGASS